MKKSNLLIFLTIPFCLLLISGANADNNLFNLTPEQDRQYAQEKLMLERELESQVFGDKESVAEESEATKERDFLAANPGYEEKLDDPPTILITGDDCTDPFIIPESYPYADTGNTCGFANLCDIYSLDNSDVIYQLDITTSTELVVSLCNSSYDTKLAIYQTTCCTGPDSAWAYNDDNYAACGTGLRSEITALFTPGTYYIVVDGYSSNCGDYILEISPPPVGRCCYGNPVQCVDGIGEEECTTTYGGEWTEGLDCSTPCPVGRCCYGNPVLCIDQISEQECTSTYSGEWVEGLDCSTPCPVGRCCDITDPYNPICTDNLHEVNCDSTNQVWSEGLACDSDPCPLPPANDSCANAILLNVPGSIQSDNLYATDDSMPFCGTSDGNQSVWYKVIGTGNTMTATTCNPYTDFDTKLRVFCNTCGDPYCVGGNDDTIGSPVECDLNGLNRKSTVVWCSDLGTEYLIEVNGFSQYAGNFQLDILDNDTTCIDPPLCAPPIGACCVSTVCVGNLSEEDCLAQAGAKWFEGEDCATFVCPSGACCVSLVCVGTLSEEDCLAQQNAQWFEGEDCATFVCQSGACCVDLVCVGNYSSLDCQALGGYWYSGEDCATFVCPEITIPTLNEWGLLIMGLLLLAIGTVAVIRKRRAELRSNVK